MILAFAVRENFLHLQNIFVQSNFVNFKFDNKMKKVGLLAIAVLFAFVANARSFELKPNGWKVGDSRSYDYVKVNAKGETDNDKMILTVKSVEKDKYLLDYQNVSDTASSGYASLRMVLGDSLASVLDSFVYKFSLTKDGEFFHLENYKECIGLFGDNLLGNILVSMVGSTQKEAEDKVMAEIKDIYWFMNRTYDDKKNNVFKRNILDNIIFYEDVPVNVRAGSVEGKLTLVLTANIPAEKVFVATEKALREMMGNMAKSMGVQPSMFDAKLKESLDELKKQENSIAIKETVVFDEKTGWLVSYDRVVDTISAAEGKTIVSSRRSITAK